MMKNLKTEFLGFSQSYQWYTGQPLSILDSGILGLIRFALNPSVGFKSANTFLKAMPLIENWQAKFRFGGDLSGWKDIEYDGWNSPISHGVRYEPDEIERVIFNISGKKRAPKEWDEDIKSVVSIILSKYKSLSELYLQPVIGSQPVNEKVRASKNQKNISEAIERFIKSNTNPKIRLGAIFCVGTTDFSDRVGHLNEMGAKKANEFLFQFYA
ncbi:MAG: hypothetical protein ACFB0B_02490 [Thermonemataceae bacterium]